MNPNRTQTEFDAFFKRLSVILAGARFLEPIEDLFALSKAWILEQDPSANTSDWSLTGIVPGTNTTADGKLYVRITGTGPYTVKGYKATGGGGGDEVFTGSGAAGATVTLTASNASGIAGSVVLSGTVTAEADDKHILTAFLGFQAYARAVFDASEPEDVDALAVLQAAYRSVAGAIRGARSTLAAVLQNPRVRVYLARIIKAENRQSFLSKRTNPDDGAIALSVNGLAEELRDAMEDNTTPQKVAVTTLAAGAVTYDAGNLGQGVLTVGAIGANMVPGKVTFKCVGQIMPNEEFEVFFEALDGKVSLRGKNRLRIGKDWNDPDLDVNLNLVRTYDKNGTDATNADVAAASFVSGVTGITSENSDDGTLYGKVVQNGANWNFELYKASGRTAADLVAKATGIAANAVFTATQQQGSGLQVAWKAGSGPTNGNLFELDVNPWKTNRVGQGADTLSFDITRSAKGEWQEEARKQFDGATEAVAQTTGWYFHQGASPTISDQVLKRNSTLFPDTAT